MSNERTGMLELTLGDSYIGSAYSPQVEVTDTETGHEVAITYMSPSGLVTERFDVADGETGPQGPAGFSPTVAITDTPTGHTVTITDAQGPHTYDAPNYAQEEQQRQDAWDALSREVTNAISDAQTATSAASTAATSATSAASSATSAAQAATTAAASANTAASAATSAATAANSAATAAGTAADSATAAAADATAAASAANTAAEAAQEAATEVAPEVAWLWDNQLTKELSGDILTASDAYAEPPLSLTVDGKSTQASTTGKNLFDKDNAPLGYYSNDGVFHSSGSGSSGYSWWSVRVSEGDVIRWADSTNNYLTGWNDGTFVQLSETRPTSPFTVPSGVDEVRGYTQNSTLSTCIVTKNNDNLTYEPYTGGKPSPSPDYPQPIESVDELVLAFAGKNLFDAANPASAIAATYTYENDTLTVTATNATTWCYLRYNVSAIEWMQAKSVTLSAIASATTTPYFGIEFFRADGSRISYAVSSTQAITRTVPYDTSYINVVFYARNTTAGAVGDTCTYNDIQLELGSTATAYEPYAGHTVPIDLQDHVLRSLPSGTKDRLTLTYLRPSTREGWGVYAVGLYQRVGEVDLGDLTWEPRSNQSKWYASCPNSRSNVNVQNRRCSAYTVIASQGSSSTPENNTIGPRAVDNVTTIYVRDDRYPPDSTTAADFKAAVAGIKYEYLLAASRTHDLGTVELPSLPSPNVTMWADPTTGLQMEYVRDTNLVVQQLNTETALAYSAIAATDGPTATANHAAGTYLTMDGVLYKVTSAIAVGETIAAGTNVSATTVMAELIALTA